MSKTETTIEELVSQIERGELRLPEMQRKYVWRGTRVRDLLDSLYRGYPSGAILVWETDSDVALQDFSVGQSQNPFGTTKLLLDGQQRLTSLSAVIRGTEVQVKNRKRPIDILFNLEHPDDVTFVTEVEEDKDDDDDELDDLPDAQEDELAQRFSEMTFVVASKRLQSLPQWISVTEVFQSDSDATFLKQAGVKDFEDPRFSKYSERLKRLRSIKKYAYTVHILGREKSYEEVTEIFVRVNSLGAKLRSSDLATAQITAKWPNSLEKFEAFGKDCDKLGFPLDTGGVIVRNMIATITGQSKFKTVGRIKAETLQEQWGASQDSLRFALNFVRSNADVDSVALLSSPFILVALALYGHENNFDISSEASKNLLKWFHLANTKGRYSRSSSESVLDQDLSVIRQERSVDELLRLLRAQVGRFEVEAGDLDGKNQRSAYFKTMFLAFRNAGATDWNSNLKISVNHSGAIHKLQFHHVFPKALINKKYSRRLVNDISNLVFISGRTNRKISATDPEKYLKKMLDDGKSEMLVSQCVPIDEKLFAVDCYPDFLEARRSLIAQRLNEFIFN